MKKIFVSIIISFFILISTKVYAINSNMIQKANKNGKYMFKKFR